MPINCLAYELHGNVLSRNINPIATQQAALDNALVSSRKRLKIERCNARIAFGKPHKEETYQFWNTIKKIGKTDAYDFKLDKIRCRVDTEVFCEILHIYPRLPNQDFMELPSEDDLLSFIKELGYSGNCEMLSTIRTDQMHSLRGRLLLEISLAIKEHMPYLRFTKVIINHFISKDNTIFIRNKINVHTVCDDTLLAYKTYLECATGKVPPNKSRKFKCFSQTQDYLSFSQRTYSEGKSKRETHKLQARYSSEVADFESEVLDEPTCNTKDTSEGTGVKPKVPDVFKEDSSDSDDDSWGESEDESDDVHDENDNDDDDGNDDDNGNDDGGNDVQDSERTNSNDDENPSFTLKDYQEEEQDEEYVHTPEKDKSDDEENMYEEEDDDVAKELYGDLNITQGLKDADMTNVEQRRADQQNASHESGFVHEEEDAHLSDLSDPRYATPPTHPAASPPTPPPTPPAATTTSLPNHHYTPLPLQHHYTTTEPPKHHQTTTHPLPYRSSITTQHHYHHWATTPTAAAGHHPHQQLPPTAATTANTTPPTTPWLSTTTPAAAALWQPAPLHLRQPPTTPPTLPAAAAAAAAIATY
nr:hypothetical protein [Tanacetum cinerariifolium]